MQTVPMTVQQSGKLTNHQLRMALCNMRPNAWLMPIAAAIMCWMFARWIPAYLLAIWWLAVTLSGLPLAYVSMKFLRASDEELGAVDWTPRVLIAFAVSALCWASQGYFLWIPNNALNHMFALLIMACTLAGNAALTGASRPLVTTGLAIYGAALVLMPLQQAGPLYDGLALLSFFYTGYLAHLSTTFYATARDMLLLRDDKNELIAALAQSKAESDEARLRAEAANRTKSEFLANMSHELRTPLNAIIGFSEMIGSGAFETRNAEYSGLINDSGRHLLALINDILDLAKIEAGRLTLQESDVDLNLMIMDCVSLMSVRALDGGVRMVPNIAADIPHVFVDDRALRQVFINLLSNAVKFTPPGGRIEIVAQVQDDGWLAIGVHDTGVGIAEDDLTRVFETFGQGRHDVVSSERGTGLGLPIVKGLLVAHGGSLSLQSKLGEGTSVTIYLPASRVLSGQALKAAS